MTAELPFQLQIVRLAMRSETVVQLTGLPAGAGAALGICFKTCSCGAAQPPSTSMAAMVRSLGMMLSLGAAVSEL
jgi:hypothetical protein